MLRRFSSTYTCTNSSSMLKQAQSLLYKLTLGMDMTEQNNRDLKSHIEMYKETRKSDHQKEIKDLKRDSKKLVEALANYQNRYSISYSLDTTSGQCQMEIDELEQKLEKRKKHEMNTPMIKYLEYRIKALTEERDNRKYLEKQINHTQERLVDNDKKMNKLKETNPASVVFLSSF